MNDRLNRQYPPVSRGMALIAVLWCVLVSSILLLGVQQFGRVNLAMAYHEVGAVQARWLARAGVEQAMAVLALGGTGIDHERQSWYEDDFYFREVPLGVGTFSIIAPADRQSADVWRYGMEDVTALVNVNGAGEQQLNQLEVLDANQVAAILDWRDQDDEVRPGGAESGYYLRSRFPYAIRNGPMQTLHELRLVRGIDDETFYGDNLDDDMRPRDAHEGQYRHALAGQTTVYSYERNRTAGNLTRLNVKSTSSSDLQEQLAFTPALAQAVMQQRGDLNQLTDLIGLRGEGAATPADHDELINEITLRWLAGNVDRITLTHDERLPARLNINTAPRQTLITLPGVTPTLADAMIAFRESGTGPFESPADLLAVSGMTESIVQGLIDRVTMRSQVFRVTSVGESESGVSKRIIAVIDRGATPASILYWYESE